MTNKLTFQELREANVKRLSSSKYVLCEQNWTHAHWMQATVGELGELANLLKKVDRGDFTLESKIGAIADELADVQTYIDIMAFKLGVDLGQATVDKFNEVSVRIGSNVFIEQNAETKKPSTMYSEVPGYPNVDAMLSYLTSVISETELSKAFKQGNPSTVISHTDKAGKRTEYKPFQLRIDGFSGGLYEYKSDHAMSEHCRVITILAAVEPTPVGEHQPEAQTAENVGSGASLDTKPGQGYVSRCASVTIPPKAKDAEQLNRQPGETHNEWRTRIEMIRDQWSPKPTVTILDHVGNQDTEAKPIDNRVQGVATMERLEGESDVEYRNRNKLGNHIVIPAYVPVKSESAAPKPDAHKYPLAVATLESLVQGFAAQFKEHSRIKGSMLTGEFWIILSSGAMWPTKDYVYQKWDTREDHVPVFYAERN